MYRTKAGPKGLVGEAIWISGAGGVQAVLPQEIQLLLIAAASDQAQGACNAADCEGCQAFRRAYWWLDSALTSHERTLYQGILRAEGIPLPDGPSEPVS